ncbi:right-handed parallel beta-helix repeat-containing protein [Sphingomonas sp. H39-1-10]|uniref:right-handed parallel beta-helix repeat-containing protein n=1 Tax=Sphingomonas pollutisoli TaxID=3030829 RepID=UPI0023B9F263|nr:right-handed parallel beta-helix repeat-containing protein [Sphingomonas pollutisoli]MDF0489879.1 right-handed parallel beta-helix repeat-containing protein [Sphingomonas pollutisoli]
MRDHDISKLSRRAVLPLLGLAGGALCVRATLAQHGTTEDAEWPKWAPTRAAFYAQIAQWRTTGKDIRQFGAKLDGQADDTVALQQAIDAGVPVLLIPAGTLRLTRAIALTRPIVILGAGDATVLRWEGRQRDPFIAVPADKNPASFLTGVHIDSLRLVRPAPLPSNGTILRGLNVRKVSVTRCSTDRFGALFVGHLRKPVRDARKDIHDLALDAGFSPAGDDLNEDIFAYDNRIDGGAYMSQILRVNYGRRIIAVGNTGRFANISWFGGSAKINLGGAPQYLRRARDIYVTHNKVHGANGGIYGNNGDGILVAHNEVSEMLDVGIDFEGCFNALAHDNIVRNAANYGLATFYAAKNIVFRNNQVYQDGSAAQLPARYGKRYGKSGGRALFALRSAGFRQSPGAIDVSFIGNRFIFGGKTGTGVCLPSYFSRLVLDGNTFENVACDLTCGSTGTMIVTRNKLSFDRAIVAPYRALGDSAVQATFTDNEIRVSAAQDPGAIAIADTAPIAGGHRAEISRNVVIDAGKGAAMPIVLFGTQGHATVSGNTVGAVYVQTRALGTVSANQTRGGTPIAAVGLPAAFVPATTEPEPAPEQAAADDTP